MHNGTKGKGVPTLLWSPDTMLIDALVDRRPRDLRYYNLHLCITHLAWNATVSTVGETRRDYVREGQARLTSLHEEPRG